MAHSFRSHRPWVLALATLAALALVTIGFTSIAGAGSKPDHIKFHLFANPAFVNCLAASSKPPTVDVTVKRGHLNDEMTVHLKGFKPGLDFDLFTVEHSNQTATGGSVSGFANFGLAWYQSDIHVESHKHGTGNGDAKIRTILLDQIFGFDPAVGLAPTATFHVGFWFNNPADAAPCGFTGFTPFNGEHHAGPLAFISRPNAQTGLGPLCTTPDSSSPSGCNP